MTDVDKAVMDVSMDTEQLHVLLRKSREEQHLTLDTVSSQLNMSLEQLERLESGEVEPANLTPFERGYVRNYAAMLHIPNERLESYFPQSKDVVSDLHSVQRYYSFDEKKLLFSSAFGKLLMFAVGAGVIALLLWFAWPQPSSESGTKAATPNLLAPLEQNQDSTEQ